MLEIVAVATSSGKGPEPRLKKYGIGKVYDDVADIMADGEIEVILNLTNPNAHYPVNMMALKAGKHVYTEKSLAVTTQEGQEIIALAQEKGLRVGAAPDTFLGGRLQTCRKLIDEGWIGKPIAATAFI